MTRRRTRRTRWASNASPDVAAERILDAARRCFERVGVAATTLGHVAEEAGCSRPTVYRYFADRHVLRQSFVDREARALGRRIGARVDAIDDPEARLVEAVLAAVRGVRADPSLAAWFRPGGVGTAADLAASSQVIHALAAGMIGADPADAEVRLRIRWLVRVIVSFLALPAEDAREERALVARFVAPLVIERARTAPARAAPRLRARPRAS